MTPAELRQLAKDWYEMADAIQVGKKEAIAELQGMGISDHWLGMLDIKELAELFDALDRRYEDGLADGAASNELGQL